ncbi:MAG: glycoside hydrolase family 1 protein [Myxococcota bacterium]
MKSICRPIGIIALLSIMALAGCGGSEGGADASGIGFPDGFIWGVAASAFQTEGHVENDYTDWISEGRSPALGDACDFWNRYAADIKLVAQAGVKVYRVSIEWARIEPEQGVFDETALAHYRDILKTIRQNGMEPMVTLHHFTNPKWVAANGWWAWDGIIDAFGLYAGYVARNLGDLVDLWNPQNEPMVYITGFSMAGMYPGSKFYDIHTLYRVFHHDIWANARAYDAIKKADIADADGDGKASQVWMVYAVSPMYPGNPKDPEYVGAAERLDYYNNLAFPNALVTGALDIDFDGKTDKVVDGLQEGVFDELRGRVDMIGVNYYTRQFVMPADGVIPNVGALPCPAGLCGKPGPVKGDNGNEVYPPGIYDALKEFSRYRIPMVVTESGVADEADTLRPSFIVMHLMQVDRARREGMDVRGFLQWSLTDNYEWAEGYRMKFGLVSVDFTTQERTRRGSFDLFAGIAASGRITAAQVQKYNIPKINPMK